MLRSTPSPDLAPLTSLLVEAIKDVCEAEAASILRLMPDGSLVFELVDGGARHCVDCLQLAPGEGVAGRVALTGCPEIVEGAESDIARRIEVASGYRVRSMLAVPLIDDDDARIGVVEALNPRSADRFAEDHLERLMQMARPLARALRAMAELPDPTAMRQFYEALVEVMSVRASHFKARTEVLEESRRTFEIHRARRYGDEKMVGLARMAAGIAHEINNPLSVALANVSQLGDVTGDLKHSLTRAAAHLDDGDAAQARRALEEADLHTLLDDAVEMMGEAHEELSRISKVVSRLMLFGDRDLTRVEEVNLAEEAERVASLARLGGLGRHHKVALEVEAITSGSVKACRTHVRQVLVELIDNALRAAERSTDPAGGRVLLRVFADGAHIHVTVEDNGPGIDVAIQHRVFDPFFTTKVDWRSTGLGLTAAYGVVRALGGIITVDSVPRRGAQFTVSFPIRARNAAKPAAVAPQRTGRYYEDLR